jgi:hypothetical protein
MQQAETLEPLPAIRAAKAHRAERTQSIAWAFAKFERFCGLLQIQPKEGGGRIPLVLSPVQLAYCAARTSRDIVLKPRQVHMTTVECARDLWWFLTKPGARVVVVCQSQTEHLALKDIYQKFRLYFAALRALGIEIALGNESTFEWTLPESDSTLRIIQAGASEASASKKGRGGTINRLHISEAAFFERAEATFNALLESVAREGSEVVNESTPNGAAGFYYEQWRAAVEGRSGYKPHFFPWWKHPEYRVPLADAFSPRTRTEELLLSKGVSAEALAWYRWKLADKGGNEELLAQEYPSDPDTCFLVGGRGFFNGARIAEMLSNATDPVRTDQLRQSGALGQIVVGQEVPAMRVWHLPAIGKAYVLSVDSSEGTGGDAGAITVFERGTGKHCATVWGQIKPRVLAGIGKWLATQYNRGELVVERNNHGGTVLAALESEHRYDNVYEGDDEKPGFNTTPVSRPVVLDTFEQASREGHFQTNDRYLLSEMRTFIVNDHGKPEATKGCHDDLVMAAAIGWYRICQPVAGKKPILKGWVA